MKGKPDQVDLWCEQWAHTRRQVLGLNLDPSDPLKRVWEPVEILGKLRCTLGQLLEDKVGAGERTERTNENGHRAQSWPEVYTGMALEIHKGFCLMRYEWRQVMDAQYVLRRLPVKKKLELLNIKNMEYWKRLSLLKIYLTGYLQLDGLPIVQIRSVKTENAATTKTANVMGKQLLTA